MKAAVHRIHPGRAPTHSIYAAILLSALCGSQATAATPNATAASPAPTTSAQQTSAPAPNATTAEAVACQAHLTALIGLVDSCASSVDFAHCDSKQIGSDDQVRFQTSRGPADRQIHYDWLRDTFTRAVALQQAAKEADSKAAADQKTNQEKASQKKARESAAPEPATHKSQDEKKPPPETAQSLLIAARLHLVSDQQALQAAEPGTAQPPNHEAERKLATAILAEHEFDQIEHPSAWDRAIESFLNWLNNLFGRIPSHGSSRWVVWTFEWLLVLAAATGLVWWLIQGSRRERWRLESSGRTPAGAPSLRDWQVWLADAEALAAAGHWREAIHMLYWAAISRLESRGLWPVDRARTPREYLDLIAATDPRRDDLYTLTRGFERIWYGYRTAAEPEYRSARLLLDKLAAR